METDVVVVGGGAAGMMCAMTAGQRGRRVVLLEGNAKAGEKIRISGGGRCNFTNVNTSPENFVSANPRFCTSALARYTPQDFIALIERHGIAYHEKKLGQLFCDGSSRDVIDMLVNECLAAGVEIVTDCRVSNVDRADQFRVSSNRGQWTSSSLVVATGGLSIPKLGTTDFGYRVAKQFGLAMRNPEPALVPLLFSAEDVRRYDGLSGVSFDAEIQCNGVSFRENALFTHRGLSGPAILQISSYWQPGRSIVINMAPASDVRERLLELKRSGSHAEVATGLCEFLPKRLAHRWSELHGWTGTLADQKDTTITAIAEALHGWTLMPAGTEGFKKAEVTRGGVDTAELSPKTLESKKVSGLYFIGEVVDVTGWLGGYNFQWAWSSGYAAGQSA
ncbi:MAG: flavoprotein [Candidatus Hydrogenedentota bacterium]